MCAYLLNAPKYAEYDQNQYYHPTHEIRGRCYKEILPSLGIPYLGV